MEDIRACTFEPNETGTGSESDTKLARACSWDVRRARREAKALNVIRNIGQPQILAPMLPVPYVPPIPDPTFTLSGHPNDTPLTQSIVYFMYSAGRIKIGFSTGLCARHNTLKKSSAFPPVVLLVIPGTDKHEKKLHARFEADRLHGEWFALSKKMRYFFRANLCPVGRARLKKAEDEFKNYCKGFI